MTTLSEDKKHVVEDDVPADIRKKISTFPCMPQAAIKLRELFKEDDVPINKIENILRQDPGLSANILRLANSAHFGVSSKVGSLKKAVLLLGLKRFEQIAISAYMNKTMDKVVEGYDLAPGELWIHSIAVATTAEAIAKLLKVPDSSDVFIAALLHDIGKLILGEFIKADSRHIESVVEKGEPMVRAEYLVLGTDHAEIGALILKRWSFPDDIVNAVRWHHDPEYISITQNCLKEPNTKSDIVYLSNLIFQSLKINDPTGAKLAMPVPEVCDRLRIKSDKYKLIAEKAICWFANLSDTLSFD